MHIDPTLVGDQLEKYCVEEILLRAVRIQARLTALTNETASIRADGKQDTFPEVVSQLEKLHSAAEYVMASLNEATPVQGTDAPFLLDTQIDEPKKYSIEKVLAKVAGTSNPSET